MKGKLVREQAVVGTSLLRSLLELGAGVGGGDDCMCSLFLCEDGACEPGPLFVINLLSLGNPTVSPLLAVERSGWTC